MRFEMKVNVGIAAVLVAVMVGSVGVGLVELTRGHYLTASIALGSIAFLVLLLRLIAWPVWYELDARGLSIHAGIQTLRLPFADIRGAARTRNATSSVAAWAFDRVRVDFRLDGTVDSIQLSPKEPDSFLQALAERTPHLALEGKQLRER